MNLIQQAGVTLNTDKCEFWRDQLTFLGHVVSISPNPDKLKAIAEIQPPVAVTELRRFMGMANQLAANRCGHRVHPKKKHSTR